MADTDITTKRCTKCGEVKPTTEFYKDKRLIGGLMARCKPCRNEGAKAWVEKNKEKNERSRKAHYERTRDHQLKTRREWYLANKDRVIADMLIANKAWKAANKDKLRVYQQNRRDRVKSSGAVLSSGIVKKLLALQRGKCACCGKPLGNDYHLDHIMPIALGGANSDNNVQLLRSECNLQKNAKHPVDFMQIRGFLL